MIRNGQAAKKAPKAKMVEIEARLPFRQRREANQRTLAMSAEGSNEFIEKGEDQQSKKKI